MTITSYGMKFSTTTAGRFGCSGLGIVYYNKENHPIFFSSELDSCIKDATMMNDGYIVTTDTREAEREGYVVLGTYTSVGIIAAALATVTYFGVNFLKKR